MHQLRSADESERRLQAAAVRLAAWPPPLVPAAGNNILVFRQPERDDAAQQLGA